TVGHSAGAVINPVSIHNGTAHGKAPSSAEAMTQGHVEEVNLILLLGVLRDALRLLDISYKMAERILPAIPEADGPLSGSGSALEAPAADTSGAVRAGFITPAA